MPSDICIYRFGRSVVGIVIYLATVVENNNNGNFLARVSGIACQ